MQTLADRQPLPLTTLITGLLKTFVLKSESTSRGQAGTSVQLPVGILRPDDPNYSPNPDNRFDYPMNNSAFTPSSEESESNALDLPGSLQDLSSGERQMIPADDPIVRYLIDQFLPGRNKDSHWEATRFSAAVYLFCECTSGWSAVVKYYRVKTGNRAVTHAAREIEKTAQARACGLQTGPLRAVQVLGAWRGVVLYEYVPGATLLELIADRQKEPEFFKSALGNVIKLLARLHTRSLSPQVQSDFQAALDKTHQYVETLSQSRVLGNQGEDFRIIRKLLINWSGCRALTLFTPALTHGDATTTNFIAPEPTHVVAIDWERLGFGDPAADVGRLSAEIGHSLRSNEADENEVDGWLDLLMDTYLEAAQPVCDQETFRLRARYYQASSTLRIARNGWLTEEVRRALLAHAMDLLE